MRAQVNRGSSSRSRPTSRRSIGQPCSARSRRLWPSTIASVDAEYRIVIAVDVTDAVVPDVVGLDVVVKRSLGGYPHSVDARGTEFISWHLVVYDLNV